MAAHSPLSTIAEVTNRIYRTGKITRADEYCFLQAMGEEKPLTTEEQRQVREILSRLQMGLLQVAD